jgi:hypothetical protein
MAKTRTHSRVKRRRQAKAPIDPVPMLDLRCVEDRERSAAAGEIGAMVTRDPDAALTILRAWMRQRH